MTNETKEFFEKFKNDVAKMKQHLPDTVSGFAGLFSKVMANGALSVREKELVALGISVAQRCAPCIRLHVQKCLDAGATKEQILEAASVAVMMGGGPAYTHIPVVMDTLEALGGS
ncbi:MAG: carboxymuconolactone decarboxylase family protein [Planctomycetota bacterium]|nr:carboxymuconolactone decarboxylase family protein [Planctomycetota bacterium]